MWFVLLLIFVTILYYLVSRYYDYWKNRGIPGPKPSLIFGNLGESVIGKKSTTQIYEDTYKQYADYPFVGVFKMITPSLLIRDPDFFKAILIKDFKNFYDNDIIVHKDLDRIVSRNPFFLKGSEWKQKRAALTSCFTSGKMKGMFSILEEISSQLVKYIKDSDTCLEAREISMRFTLNNVAACAFGLEGKCFIETNAEFRKLADEFLSPSKWNSFKLMLMFMCPPLSNLFKIQFIPQKVEQKLIDMVAATLDYRRNNKIIRNDFLEYVSEVVEKSDLFDGALDVTAQAATFFGDGYETSSRTMSFFLYLLADNPKAQKKLREEINQVCEKYKNKWTYEAIQDMTYLDACFYESMRVHPVLGQLQKICTEKYTYTPTNTEYQNVSVTLEEGTSVILPIAAINRDKKYFENPDEFIPERFLDKDKISKTPFYPFGEGPRLCLGLRFAALQIKLGVAKVVKNFEMTVNKKTKLPLTFDPYYILLAPVGGLWIDFKSI